MATGFVFHELYMWHNTWNWAQVFAPGLTIQPGEHAENPETKRRFRNLLEVSGLLDHLVAIRARPASEDELGRAHTREHIARIKAMSAENGGDASTLTPFGKGSFEIAQLAAGGTMAAFDAVIAKGGSSIHGRMAKLGKASEQAQLGQADAAATIYRELIDLGAAGHIAKRVAQNSRCWWRNRDGDIKRVLTIAYFDKLGVPRLS